MTKEDDTSIIARLSRKLTKATKQNHKLRQYAKHLPDCKAIQKYSTHLGSDCTCGLAELLNPKRQEPI